MTIEMIEGDCREILRELPDASIDSVVTDPPYALVSIVKRFGKEGSAPAKGNDAYMRASKGFMGKAWDTGEVAFAESFWAEVLRVLKPGGHVLSFGGTRSYHRMACAIEDAGFEIRDMLSWVFGSGFPKSHNQDGEWEGWGTALKPAHEPICLARKPLIGTVATNLAAHGVGAINIDGCRVGTDERLSVGSGALWSHERDGKEPGPQVIRQADLGRWPANLIHDGSDEVIAAFPNAPGQLAAASSSSETRKNQNVYGAMARGSDAGGVRNDSGSAARFFKATKPDAEELLIWRAKAIMAQWNQELANTADDATSLSKLAVVSALKDAVTSASQGTLISSLELSTSATPSELRRISEAVIIAILSIENGCSLESLRIRHFLRQSRVSVAEAPMPIGITTITISHWKSDGSAEPVIFNCTQPNTELGGLASDKRFIYCAKASKTDRGEGNIHPTVKPIALMRYLCRLITPPGGTVLDPFAGSGSTGVAADLEGFSFIGVEADAEYFDIAAKRLGLDQPLQAAE